MQSANFLISCGCSCRIIKGSFHFLHAIEIVTGTLLSVIDIVNLATPSVKNSGIKLCLNSFCGKVSCSKKCYTEYGSLGFVWDPSYYPEKQNNMVRGSEMISGISVVATVVCCA